jgi:hypothetical protein
MFYFYRNSFFNLYVTVYGLPFFYAVVVINVCTQWGSHPSMEHRSMPERKCDYKQTKKMSGAEGFLYKELKIEFISSLCLSMSVFLCDFYFT